jgi:hypothetical protein
MPPLLIPNLIQTPLQATDQNPLAGWIFLPFVALFILSIVSVVRYCDGRDVRGSRKSVVVGVWTVAAFLGGWTAFCI